MFQLFFASCHNAFRYTEASDGGLSDDKLSFNVVRSIALIFLEKFDKHRKVFQS
ncbi:MAG: hypothetical protein AVDCRST_MAG96-2319 [uncultured Segetibacter sp.]|uniref:Uncharacterized protein n=1 Tax=uncultured Segetibacter sp. TaxID=481133 RepID=A0A6J4SY24_9BACT|nr:MAG: hypothetical protein AVDCRST_MAG96-2319 [uncultured Segetibacter sp.]